MSVQLRVQFIEILDRYSIRDDIECKYKCLNYKIQDGDRIAIFKMGWKSLRHYILFEWVCEEKMDWVDGWKVNSVIFSKYDLPHSGVDNDELYQFCYISGENVVQGIGTPFQIISENLKSPMPNLLMDVMHNRDKCGHLKRILSEKDKEIASLKEENSILKESFKLLLAQNQLQEARSCEEDIANLKEVTVKLKDAILGQQKEIDMLRIEMKKEKSNYKKVLVK